MLYYLVLGLTATMAFSIIRWKRAVFYKLALASTSVLNIMLSKQEDDEKLKDLESNTLQLLKSLLAFIGILLLMLLVFLIGANLGDVIYSFSGDETRPEYSSWQSILSLSIGATVPFLIPYPKSQSGYSELAKLLHRMILDNYFLHLRFHKRALKKNKLNSRKDFVIVSGLARAGTTSLMNLLATSSNLRSLSYDQMPFIMDPNGWSFLKQGRKGQTKERSHKDGIQIGLDSNEALEEYFWKLQSVDQFIGENEISEYQITEEDHQAYLDYQALVRQSEGEMYLAKNNNFILRYSSLRTFNADFLMVILFRDPLSHAASLLEKHQQYKSLQKEDEFILEYMNWLGHHEFGLNHKPFKFAEEELISGDPNHLDYWLKVWMNYYRQVLKLDPKNLSLISYEDFCTHPEQTALSILERLGLKENRIAAKAFNNAREVALDYSRNLHLEAEEIYKKLLERSRLKLDK